MAASARPMKKGLKGTIPALVNRQGGIAGRDEGGRGHMLVPLALEKLDE